MPELPDAARVLMDRAEEDAAALLLLFGVSGLAPRIFGFHAQQAVEKAAKAWLISLGFSPGKTHSLQFLLVELQRRDAKLPTIAPELLVLQPFAVDERYLEPTTGLTLSRLTVIGQVDAFMAAARTALGREKPGEPAET